MPHLVETMAYSGETPWHGLGVEVSNDLTPEQMLVAAGLDWEVKVVPITYPSPLVEFNDAGKRLPPKTIRSKKAAILTRTSDGAELDVVSPKWNPLQNAEAFDFFKEFVDEGKMEMHTAGSLKEGRMVWALAKLPNEGFELAGGDMITGHLLFANPHEFGKAIQIMFTPIRVVCKNTLTMALEGKRSAVKVAVNHRRVFDAQAVKETLGLADKHMKEFKQYAEFLQKRRYTQENVTLFLDKVFPKTPSEKKADEKAEKKTQSADEVLSRNARLALKVIDTQPGADIKPGSWWNAFNVVTFLTDHVIGRTDDSRLHSAWFGPNHDKKIAALQLAAQMASS